jgi:hypothetical protein
MFNQRPDHLLCACYPFDVFVWFCKKTAQPFFATTGAGKIEFMKNGKFLFLVEDGNVIKRNIVNLHSEW